MATPPDLEMRAAERRLRCFVAGVQHESSSFSPIPTGLADFISVEWGHDPEPATLGFGYGESCRIVIDLGWELIPGPFSNAQPALPASHSVWENVRDGILEPLLRAGAVDVVWLCLHGAQMSDRETDCEGDLLERVRAIVGDEAAIGCLLDLHANLSERMLHAADLVVACREYPHIDYGQRAAEMLPVLARIRAGEVRPTTAAVRFMGPGPYPTTEEPMRSFVARFTAAQREAGVLMVSVMHGFEGSDQPDLAASVVVTTDSDPALASRLAADVGADFLETVLSREWRGPGVDEAIDVALAATEWPVVIADRSDNAGGGAAGDATFVLAALLHHRVEGAAVALFWDPVAVDLCHAAGAGARIPLRVGGKCGPMSGDPLDVDAEVIAVREGARQALFGAGQPLLPLGRSAAIRVAGIEVVLSSIRQQVFSHHVFTQHGIDHLARRILVVKSTQHFMNDFGPIAASVIRCDGPGTLTPELSALPFRRATRPMLRLDPVDRVEIEPIGPVAVRERSLRQS